MSRLPPQTTKQAKAAYKARKQSAVSEEQQRLIERDGLLHRRAWAAKDREKSSVLAAQKRADKAQRERLEESNAARFGTQRRVGRFGHKSSQYHLGAFFRCAPSELGEQQGSLLADIDDEDLLSVLRTPGPHPEVHEQPPPALAETRGHVLLFDPDGGCNADHDLVLLWSDFDSSTQIANDLAVVKQADSFSRSPRSTTSSLGLTLQDIEGLDPQADSHQQLLAETRQVDRMLPQLDGSFETAQGFSNTQLEACLDEDLVLSPS